MSHSILFRSMIQNRSHCNLNSHVTHLQVLLVLQGVVLQINKELILLHNNGRNKSSCEETIIKQKEVASHQCVKATFAELLHLYI